MGELSRGVRGVVFVFDLLLNFQFVFSLLNTFGHPPRTASFSRTSSWTCLWTSSRVSLSDPLQTPFWPPPSKVTHFLLTALHRTATFGPDPGRPSFDLWVFRGWIRLLILRCPEVGSYFVTFVVVAAAVVSVVIWRYAIGRSLSIWNARMMQLIIFFGRTLGEVARGARRRLFRLQISNCNFDFKTRWVNSREEFEESSSFLICF